MSNRLSRSLSPYLKQHENNPVDWYEWGTEALGRSRQENKPIFLSIGYSACHWCHVMERESFSDVEIAKVLNENFVCIKVDREERPDLDHIYMTALQMMSGQGGWPLNIFLTPDLRPFFGGTYFPPDTRYGRPPFREILEKIAYVYSSQRDLVRKNSDQLVGLLAQQGQFFESRQKIDAELQTKVLDHLRHAYDPKGGGLGGAPKFFHIDGLRLLLKSGVENNSAEDLEKVVHSLTQMAIGGVYDQVGGGFHRYSTDAHWQIPHFEKMLYDNALLLKLYLEAYQVTKTSQFKDILTETSDWALREMTSPQGGFYSAIDADSEHHEGKFYVWSRSEILSNVPANLHDDFIRSYSVTEEGNFEGTNILHSTSLLSHEQKTRLRPALDRLLEVRSKRVWPLVDRKILTSWNGLMISGLSRVGFSLSEPRYLDAARASAERLWAQALKDGKLRHLVFDEHTSERGFLEDYAYFSEGLLDLFEVTTEKKYFDWAVQLTEKMMADFYDTESGGFWSTDFAREDLLVRTKEIYDGALPAAYHLALSVLHRLFELTGELRYRVSLEKSIQAILGSALESPGGFHRFALVVDEFVRGSRLEIHVSPTLATEEEVRLKFAPRKRAVLWKSRGDLESIPAFNGKWSTGAQSFVCEAGVCQIKSDGI